MAHLTHSERDLIESGLRNHDSFKEIARKVGKSPSSISREVLKHRVGSEFSNPEALEKNCLSKGRRTRIFYCDPYSSWQKGHVENNHENLRKIFPKGVSLNRFSPEQIQLAVSHLNSFARASLNNIPAISLFEQLYHYCPVKNTGIDC